MKKQRMESFSQIMEVRCLVTARFLYDHQQRETRPLLFRVLFRVQSYLWSAN
jgi:hypothetical protein